MSITVYAYSNDKARLLQKKAVFYNDSITPYGVKDLWEQDGFIVELIVGM